MAHDTVGLCLILESVSALRITNDLSSGTTERGASMRAIRTVYIVTGEEPYLKDA